MQFKQTAVDGSEQVNAARRVVADGGVESAAEAGVTADFCFLWRLERRRRCGGLTHSGRHQFRQTFITELLISRAGVKHQPHPVIECMQRFGQRFR